jgi:hypothetical protein
MDPHHSPREYSSNGTGSRRSSRNLVRNCENVAKLFPSRSEGSRRGSGYAARTINYRAGAGPHLGIALDHNLTRPGLFFLTNLDIADTFTRIRQRFSTATTTLTPAGQPARGQLKENFVGTKFRS